MMKKILLNAVPLLTALLFFFTANAQLSIDSVRTKASSCTNNGSITIFAQTANGTILYAITGGPVTYPEQTSNIFSSLPPGSYTIEVFTTSVEKLVTATVITGDYQLPDFIPLVTAPDCPGNSTAIIDGNLTFSSGLSPYTWELTAPSTVTRPAQDSPVFNNLPQGLYSLRLTDACNNIQTKLVTVFAPPNTMTELTDFVYVTGCDTAQANVLLLVSDNRPPYKISYTAGGTDYTIDTANVISNGAVQLIFSAPNVSYGDAFTNITITNSCGTQLYIPRVNICPFVFSEIYSVTPGPHCSSAVLTIFSLGEFGVCGNTIPKYPFTITIKDAITNNLVETKVYKNQFDGSLSSVAMLPGTSYNITFTDSCNHQFNQNITTPAKERYIDYSSSGQQTLLDSTAITYIYAHGFPSTGTTLVVTGGPPAAHSSKKGYTYTENYIYPKAFTLQQSSDSSLICPIYNTYPGTYYYTIRDSCGNAYPDSFTVSKSEVADFYFKYGYTKACAGESGLQYEFLHNTFSNFTVTDIKTGTTIFSQNVANSQNPYSGILNNLKATDYQMAIDYYGGGFDRSLTNILVDHFTALDTVHILPYQNPSLQSSSSILCNGTLSLILTADSSKGIPPYQYEIISGPQTFPPQESNLFQLTQKGLYRIRLIDKCGNSVATDVTVDDLVFPELSKIGNSCINGKAELTYGASSYFSYTWTKPDGSIFKGDTLIISPVTAADTGIYTISRLTTINGCTGTQSATYRLTAGARDSMAVSICNGQTYTFGNKTLTLPGIYRDTIATAFCDSISILKLIVTNVKKDSSVAVICKGQSYLFGNRSLTQTGIYRDTIVTSACDSISIINLTVNDIKKDSSVISICQGQSYFFGSKLLTQTGIYRDTLATPACDSISIIDLSVSDYKKDSIAISICMGQSYTFGNKIFTQNGLYSDTLKTATCDSISILHLTVNSLPVIKAQSDKFTVVKGETIQLSVTPSDLNSYLWTAVNPISNNNISNPTSLVNISSQYTVLVTDANNCTNTDSLFIQLVTDSIIHTCSNTSIYIPTAFTPNNDGKNDFFKISGINNVAYRGYHLVIFNRYGQKIFESGDPSQYWDGRYQGKYADPGNYVYSFRFICEDGRTFNQNGNIILLR